MPRYLIRKIFLLLVLFSLSGCDLDYNLPATAGRDSTSTPFPRFTPAADVTVMPRDERPNIILILVDDLDAKLGTIQYMPHLQELLVQQGLSIDKFLITTTLCCPSRSTILRGQYTHCHQVYTNEPPYGGFETFYKLGRESSTVGTWLQAAGYRTVLLGKYLNGYPLRQDRGYVPPGWTEWYSPAKGSAYLGLDYTLNENGKLVAYSPDSENYLTDVLGRKTVDFIQRASSDPAPFFIYLAPYTPHVPAQPALRHQNLFLDLRIPRSPSFNEQDVNDKIGPMQLNPLLTEAEIAQLDADYVKRVQSMQSVDEMVQAVFETLETTGELDNTYVIFTSDNGYHMGQHRLQAGKGRPYEEDIVVPFIIRGPGIPAGLTLSDYLSGNVDIAPTIAGLAGVTPPPYVDGRSLLPLLNEDRPQPADWRRAFLVEFYGNQDSEDASAFETIGYSTNGMLGVLEPPDPADLQDTPSPSYLGLRTNRYLYVEMEDGSREFYDLISDPYQLENIASSADHVLLETLSTRLHALAACAGETCRSVENEEIP